MNQLIMKTVLVPTSPFATLGDETYALPIGKLHALLE